MSTEVIEASIGLWALMKWAFSALGGLLLAVLGYNVRRAQNDLDNMKEAQHKHETESAEKFGEIKANIKMLSETIPRIHERIDDIHSFLISGKK